MQQSEGRNSDCDAFLPQPLHGRAATKAAPGVDPPRPSGASKRFRAGAAVVAGVAGAAAGDAEAAAKRDVCGSLCGLVVRVVRSAEIASLWQMTLWLEVSEPDTDPWWSSVTWLV